MASEIKVDTIVNAGGDNDTGIDLATNDQILLKVANATKLTMNSTGQTTIVGEGGTTTTSLQQGLCKHWVKFAPSASAADSFNNSGVTDNSTGDFTIARTNNLANSNYSTQVNGDWTKGSDAGLMIHSVGNNTLSTSSVRLVFYNSSNAEYDSDGMNASIHGDLA